MAFPHLQQPSFLLVNISCPCECQLKAEGPGSSFHQLELSSGCFRVHVMGITLDSGLKSLGLTLPLQDLGFTQPLSPGFLIYEASLSKGHFPCFPGMGRSN